MGSADEELTTLSQTLEERATAFGVSFPDVTARHPTLASLVAFAERRVQLMEQAASARSQAAALTIDAALLEPAIELAGSAEL